MNACKSCAAPLLWAVTDNGKRIPLDPTPTSDGNIVFVGDTVHVLRKSDDERPLLAYTSHFVTCPFADRHRKQRSRR